MAKVASAFAASGYTSCLFMAALGVPAMPEMIALNEVVCLYVLASLVPVVLSAMPFCPECLAGSPVYIYIAKTCPLVNPFVNPLWKSSADIHHRPLGCIIAGIIAE
jgi:hypothetical protein